MNYNTAISQIKAYLKDKGYSIGKYTEQNLISTIARIEYNEEIENPKSKTYCSEWLTNKLNTGNFDLKFPKKKQNRSIKKVLTREKKVTIKGQNRVINVPLGYKEFLKTDYWKNIRKKVLIRDNKRCVKCFSTARLHVHHLTYENHYHEDKHMNDLITLCNDCHKKAHGI